VRLGVAFATAEIGMTLVGAAIGSTAGKLIGDVAGYIGFVALIGIGIYMMYESTRSGEKSFDFSRGWGLAVGALSLSVDSLGIGFSILFIGVPLPVSIAFIAGASILSTTTGLTLGRAFGARVEHTAARWAGIVLVVTGVFFAVEKYFGRS
jgi:putative Mn2+ efflux pump MntP